MPNSESGQQQSGSKPYNEGHPSNKDYNNNENNPPGTRYSLAVLVQNQPAIGFSPTVSKKNMPLNVDYKSIHDSDSSISLENPLRSQKLCNSELQQHSKLQPSEEPSQMIVNQSDSKPNQPQGSETNSGSLSAESRSDQPISEIEPPDWSDQPDNPPIFEVCPLENGSNREENENAINSKSNTPETGIIRPTSGLQPEGDASRAGSEEKPDSGIGGSNCGSDVTDCGEQPVGEFGRPKSGLKRLDSGIGRFDTEELQIDVTDYRQFKRLTQEVKSEANLSPKPKAPIATASLADTIFR